MKRSKNNKVKILFAKVVLVLLGVAIVALTGFRFLTIQNSNNENKKINKSSENAISKALGEIVANFNKDEDVIRYQSTNDVKLIATTEGESIYISYIDDDTTNYEFVIKNDETLHLYILIDKGTDDEQNKFNIIYQFLVEAVQKRLNNKNDISSKINDFLINDVPCNGLSKNKLDKKIEYKINILDKI